MTNWARWSIMTSLASLSGIPRIGVSEGEFNSQVPIKIRGGDNNGIRTTFSAKVGATS